MENDLISRSALVKVLEKIRIGLDQRDEGLAAKIMQIHIQFIEGVPAVDAVEVVRCKDCKHGVWNEDEQMYQCVEDADYNPELDMYIGFICYEEADFFCKRGERRADDEG